MSKTRKPPEHPCYVYVFVEKSSDTPIYVGSSSRLSARLKEHVESIRGSRRKQKIHAYMNLMGLELYRDVEVRIISAHPNIKEGQHAEAAYYYLHQETLQNDRPAENRFGEFNPKRKAVKCLETGEEFPSVLQAAAHYRTNRQKLNSNISNGNKHKMPDGRMLTLIYQ